MLYFIIFVALVIAFIKISDLKSRISSLEEKVSSKQPVVQEARQNIPVVVNDNKTPSLNNVIAANENILNETPAVSVDAPVIAAKTQNPEPVIIEEKIVEKKTPDQGFEFKFGAKFFTVIGSIAITFGVGYFLKYAFDNNLINEAGRVAIGIVLGIAITVLGIWLSKKYSLFGQILSGTGLGLIYLSVYSAYGFYHLVPVSAGFVGLILVTIGGMTLAVYQDLLWMAVFSQLGAYLAPVLLSSGENHPHILFMYVIGIIIGTFGVAWFKLWRPLVAVNYVATAFLFISWAGQFLDKSQVGIAVTYLTIFFALFTGILFVNYLVGKAKQDAGDFILLSLNSMLTFVGYYLIVDPYYHNMMGGLAVAFAAVHFALAFMVSREDESSSRLKEFFLAIGSILFTLALPIIFDSHSVLTISWSLEALVLILFGARVKAYSLRVIGLIIQMVVIGRVLFQDIFTYTNVPAAKAFFNERFLTFLLITVITALIGWIYHLNKDKVTEGEVNLIKIFPVIVGVEVLVFGSVEISDFLANYWIVVSWSVILSVIFVLGNLIKSYGLILLGYVLMIVSCFNFITIGSHDAHSTSFSNPYFGVLIFATIMGIVSVLLLRIHNTDDKDMAGFDMTSYLSIYSFIALAIAFSKEIITYDYSYALLPVVWSVCAVILLIVAYYFKSVKMRFVTYLSVIFAGIYCFFTVSDILKDSNYNFIFNYRFMAMLVVSVISLWIVYMTRVHEEVGTDEKKSVSLIFAAAGNALLLFGISQEVWGEMTRRIDGASADSARNLSQFRDVLLSITWAVYGSIVMIFGIYKYSRFCRLFGLALLGVVIFKIFFMDASGLETAYKILAYITLGVILLIAGFLYNKFKDRIINFVK